MLLIIEILFLIFGLWALISGKLPSFLFGGGNYRIEGQLVRVLGVLMMAPLPLAIMAGIVIVAAMGEDGLLVAALVEIGLLVGVMILGVIIVERVREPVMAVSLDTGLPTPQSAIEHTIANKANRALIMGLLCFTGVPALIFGPRGLISGLQSIRLIDEHNTGHQHHTKALIGAVLSGLLSSVCLILIITFFALLILDV